MQYQPFSPVDIRFPTFQSFQTELSNLNGKHMIIMASKGTVSRLKELIVFDRLLKDKNNRIVSDINSNPSVEDVCNLINMLRYEDKNSTILAIGGGSCIDIAKAVSALRGLAVTHEVDYGDIVNAIAEKNFFTGYERSEIIAVPTTSGTGSEVTKWATVWDMKNKKKLSVEHPECFPKAAFIIPELTRSMTARITLSTGLDALSHAVEAYWAKARNPLSQMLSLYSIDKIKNALPAALEHPHDLEARKEMCLGSLLAGLAFSITKTTACHSISYPLTMNHGIEHGFAAALTISPIMDINSKAVPEIKEITKLFGGLEGFNAWIANVTKGIQSLKLSAFGIQKYMIENIVHGAITSGRMDNNPIQLKFETIKSIIESVF